MKIMKTIIESSVYLLIMVLICLFSIDFISMNIGITQMGQIEQYVEDYIELNGKCLSDNAIDESTIDAVNETLKQHNMTFSYEYVDCTESYAYYKVKVYYPLRSALFNLGKNHTFDGIARVEL